MSRERWKRHERQVAHLLGGTRLPATGQPTPDVVAGWLVVEVKLRKRLPQWLTTAVAKARRAAQDWQLGLAVLVESPGQGHKAQRYVVLSLDDWLAWFGDERLRHALANRLQADDSEVSNGTSGNRSSTADGGDSP